MSSLSIDIEDYRMINDGSFYREFKQICETSSIFTDVRLLIFQYRLNRIVRKLKRINNSIIHNLYKYDYTTIGNYVSEATKIVDSMITQSNKCGECGSVKCKVVMIDKLYGPTIESFMGVLDTIKQSQYFNADNYFSEDEYVNNNDELSVFADLWDYDSSEEDSKIAFEYNSQEYHSK
mgnify:CR=1 FL=1